MHGDPVGAGDAFTAAFTVALLQGRPIREAARFAHRLGALVASRVGAMPDVDPEYAELRARV
jgi:sugar/nucleoside kinase (ribokinase family)